MTAVCSWPAVQVRSAAGSAVRSSDRNRAMHWHAESSQARVPGKGRRVRVANTLFLGGFVGSAPWQRTSSGCLKHAWSSLPPDPVGPTKANGTLPSSQCAHARQIRNTRGGRNKRSVCAKMPPRVSVSPGKAIIRPIECSHPRSPDQRAACRDPVFARLLSTGPGHGGRAELDWPRLSGYSAGRGSNRWPQPAR